jgi:hypothetical protein
MSSPSWRAADGLLIRRGLHGAPRSVLTHSHMHRHEEHHRYEHADGWDGSEPHACVHEHEPIVHRQTNYPDPHHLRRHG